MAKEIGLRAPNAEVVIVSFLEVQKALEENPQLTAVEAIDIIQQVALKPRLKVTDKMREALSKFLLPPEVC